MSSNVEALDACAPGADCPDKVALAMEALPPLEVIEEISSVFKLLGDPTRTRLLYTLLDAGELCVCDLAEATGVTETTVSQALRLMRSSRGCHRSSSGPKRLLPPFGRPRAHVARRDAGAHRSRHE